MNKYQEALDKIKSCTNIIIDKGENYTLVKNEVPQECFDSLQELINYKNLKPNNKITKYGLKYYCPKCGTTIARKYKFCWKCGIQFDWRKENYGKGK